MKDKQTFMAMFSSAVSMFCIGFFSSFLTLRFKKHYGIANGDDGYYYAILTSPYLISCAVMPGVFKVIPRRLQFVLCFVFSALGYGLMGPSEWLLLPDKLGILLAGMAITGFVQAMSFIPSLPESVDQTILRFRIVEGLDTATDSKMHDTLSSIYIMTFGMSNLFAPFIGGILYDHFGYENTMNIGMLILASFAFIYAVFNCGCNVFA